MNSAVSFFRSSIGRKLLMAVSGLILIGFIVGHLVGNLQIYSPADKINGYAEFLHSLGPTLWVVRILLLFFAVVHIWSAISLTRDNQKARGAVSKRYAINHTIRATLASRTMRISGFVVLAFVIYHLAQFTVGVADRAHFKETLQPYTMQADYHIFGVTTVHKGDVVLDVQSMMIYGFQQPLISIFYIVAIGLLSYHLLHGFDSMFQTLGLRNGKWSGGLRKFSIAFSLLYFFFNVTIPVSILAGRVTLRPEVAAIRGASVAQLPAQR